MLLSLEI